MPQDKIFKTSHQLMNSTRKMPADKIFKTSHELIGLDEYNEHAAMRQL